MSPLLTFIAQTDVEDFVVEAALSHGCVMGSYQNATVEIERGKPLQSSALIPFWFAIAWLLYISAICTAQSGELLSLIGLHTLDI